MPGVGNIRWKKRRQILYHCVFHFSTKIEFYLSKIHCRHLQRTVSRLPIRNKNYGDTKICHNVNCKNLKIPVFTLIHEMIAIFLISPRYYKFCHNPDFLMCYYERDVIYMAVIQIAREKKVWKRNWVQGLWFSRFSCYFPS